MLDETADAVEQKREIELLKDYKTNLALLLGFFCLIAIVMLLHDRPSSLMDGPISNRATYQNPAAW